MTFTQEEEVPAAQPQTAAQQQAQLEKDLMLETGSVLRTKGRHAIHCLTVIVAVGTIKLRCADTASGMPMECPPPSTRVAVGFVTPAISSARASPASTSPPTVFRITSSPSMAGSSCTATTCGITCSYLVVF